MSNVVKLIVGRARKGEALPKVRECVDCEAPIETARLQLVKNARRCVSCEAEREQRLERRLEAAGENDIAIIRR